ncbi:alpha/beta fold hydrolase [Actinomadura sp. LD22]|uniref:Alpha/beta fold hydrolase n=1 Tax=Actinomadura physcomitrii TaxID=2650748 RepID=A0A6I4M5B0_9ACTN|nr:S9 family peptidase [Actinomadura physcomitrii]MVZ99030.1 alpha/beta fold hydrolase [Actinomadura physcomitrii]
MPGYRDFVPRQGFQPTLALSPDARTVAYAGNAGGHFDLWTVAVGGGEPRQLTRLVDQAVRRIAWAPDGKSLVFAADREGDEQYRLYRIGLDDEGPIEISSGRDCQRVLATSPFDAAGRFLVYAANDRDATVQDVLIRDLAEESERRIQPPAGVVFEPVGISPDGRWLLAGGFRSNSQVDAYLIDLQDAAAEPVCVTTEHGDGFFEPAVWAADSSGFYLRTDLWGEYTSAAFYRLTTRELETVTRHDWDVEHIDVAGDTLVWSVNEDGRSVLHARQGRDVLQLPSMPPGVIAALAIAPAAEPIVVLFDTATRPAEIAALDPAEEFRYLTDARPPALRVFEPVEPEPVVYPASAGRSVHALVYRPTSPGPHPVLLSIHGGPEAQERPMYLRSGLYQHLVSRGIAVFAPNIAGSTGYGKAHQKLIYRDWGGPDLDDLAHAARYLQADPGIDGDRIAVMGGSYGGFAALSCLARLPHNWAAGVSLCGPTNLVTLARACPPTWKNFVATVLGDPETHAEYLTRRSPITYADSITAPVFVLQGARDPRVPRSEADRFVARLREHGVDVRYDVFEDEGHGFTNRENELRAYEEIAQFLCSHLL